MDQVTRPMPSSSRKSSSTANRVVPAGPASTLRSRLLAGALAVAVAWAGASLARRPATARFTYGLKGSTILAALANALLAWWLWRAPPPAPPPASSR